MRKLAILGLAGLLAIVSAGQAFSNAVARTQPAIAAKASPMPVLAHERLATTLIDASDDGQTIEVSSSLPHAHAAVSGSLLASEALAIIALGQEDAAAREELLLSALATTRRGRVLNSAVMMSAASSEDAGTLIDALNRTMVLYPSQAEALIPVLVEQMADPAMRPAFVELLDTSPAWARKFWLTVATQPELAESAAIVRLGMSEDAVVDERSDQAILRLMTRTGRLQDAANVFARSSAADQLSVQSGSMGWDREFIPFDWQFYDASGRFARPDADGETLTVSVRAGYGGLLARRLIVLGQTAPTFTISHSLDPASASRVRLTLNCADSDVSWSDTLSRSPTTMRVDTEMPCDLAWLGIEARATSGSQNISGQILDITRN